MAHDHCIPRSLIGRKGRDRPSSLRTTRCEPVRPKAIIMNEKVYMDFGILQIMLHAIGLQPTKLCQNLQ